MPIKCDKLNPNSNLGIKKQTELFSTQNQDFQVEILRELQIVFRFQVKILKNLNYFIEHRKMNLKEIQRLFVTL